MSASTLSRAGLAPADLTRGILWALAAGIFWGGAFIAPLVLQGYTSFEIAAGRFAGSGVFSIAMLAITFARGRAQGLGSIDIWITAAVLGLAGGFFYFVFLTEGVQRANAAIITLIIGTLPIAIPLVAQWTEATFDWRKSLVPSGLILAGLLAVHSATYTGNASGGLDARYVTGLLFAFAALAIWTWYAIHNARILGARPEMSAVLWSSIQGVAQLPFALPILVISAMAGATHGGSAAGGRVPFETFIWVSFALGIATSWMAMLCWNRASQILPAALAGQLIAFETVASLTYVYLWTQAWPPLLVVAGAALLLGGVLLGVVQLSRDTRTSP